MKFIQKILLLSLSFVVLANLNASDLSAILTFKVAGDSPFVASASDPLAFTEGNRVQILGELDLAKGMSLVASGYYQFGISGSLTEALAYANTYDLNDAYLKLALSDTFGPQSSFSLVAGRSLFYDFSTQVLAQKLDGIQLNFATPGLSSRLALGTTALQFKSGNAILITSSDLASVADAANFLAPPRLVAIIEVKKNELIPGQNLTAGVVGQLDISPEQAKDASTAADGVPVNTVYLGLGLDGKLISGLYYTASGYLQAGTTLSAPRTYASDLILAGMGDFGINYFVKPLMGSRFSLSANISSGDTDLDANQTAVEANTAGLNNFFTGISKKGGGIIYTQQFGNSFGFKGGWSFKPLTGKPGSPELALTLDGQALFRLLAAGPISEALVSGTTQNYLGSEVDLTANFRPLSDLSLALKTAVFVPNALALPNPLSWKAGLDVSLSF